MKPTTFAVKDFSALHSTTEATFAEAEATARRYSAEGGGNCPATITDSHGCEWSVWAIGDIVTATNLGIAAVAALIGYGLVEFVRNRL